MLENILCRRGSKESSIFPAVGRENGNPHLGGSWEASHNVLSIVSKMLMAISVSFQIRRAEKLYYFWTCQVCCRIILEFLKKVRIPFQLYFLFPPYYNNILFYIILSIFFIRVWKTYIFLDFRDVFLFEIKFHKHNTIAREWYFFLKGLREAMHDNLW